MRKLWSVTALVVLPAFLLLDRHMVSRTAPADPPPLVSVVVARPQTLQARLVLAGTIVPRAEVDLGARESGIIATVSVGIGSHVRLGEVLASLDTAELRADVAAAQARVAVATANAEAAARAYGRVAGIAGTGAMAPEEIDQRAADAMAREAQIDVAKADLAEAEAQLQAATITAPMDGVIAARNAEPGQFAAPGGPPLFTLISDQGLIFKASAPQDQLVLIKPGMAASLALPGGAVAGPVVGIDPSINPNSHLGTVRIALPADPDLIPGAFVEASIDLGQRTLLAVPRGALVAGADGFHLMEVIDRKAVIHPVTLRSFPGNTSFLVPIAAGIAAGDEIVAVAGASLRDGETVRTTP